jgi:hypothetical protein
VNSAVESPAAYPSSLQTQSSVISTEAVHSLT